MPIVSPSNGLMPSSGDVRVRILLFACLVALSLNGSLHFAAGQAPCDEGYVVESLDCCDACDDSCDALFAANKKFRSSSILADRYRTSAMLSSFFGATPLGARGSLNLDRLIVIAYDLDAPAPLPSLSNPLTLTEQAA